MKKREILIKSLSFFLWVCCAACSLEETPQKGVFQPRVSLSSTGNTLNIKASMESPEGFSLDGGLVHLIDPAGEVTPLEYDQTRTAYVGQKYSPPSGKYQVQFRSAGYPGSLVTMDYMPLNQKPEILQAMDGGGNSAFLGQNLDSAKVIQVSWKPVQGATVYSFRIYQNQAVVYATSTSEAYVTIPSRSIASPGQSMIQVQGQRLEGDPLFTSENYYVASVSDFANLYISVVKP